jgi:hypothetical protein
VVLVGIISYLPGFPNNGTTAEEPGDFVAGVKTLDFPPKMLDEDRGSSEDFLALGSPKMLADFFCSSTSKRLTGLPPKMFPDGASRFDFLALGSAKIFWDFGWSSLSDVWTPKTGGGVADPKGFPNVGLETAGAAEGATFLNRSAKEYFSKLQL